MVTASAIAAVLCLANRVPHPRRSAGFCAALAIVSFLRFSNLRWKAVQQTYRFFIALKSESFSTTVQSEENGAADAEEP